ncbi:hypothetical protein [Haloferax mucosum]
MHQNLTELNNIGVVALETVERTLAKILGEIAYTTELSSSWVSTSKPSSYSSCLVTRSTVIHTSNRSDA